MDGELDLRKLIGLLRRQMKLILAVFLAVAGIAAVAVFTTIPIYTATALVMVDPAGKNVLETQSPMEGSASANSRIDGEVLLASSDNVLLTVIDRERLIDDPEFRPTLGFSARILSFLRLREPTLPTADEALRQTLGKLESMVTVQRRGLTFLIAVNARSENPEKAARLANAISRAYIDGQLTSKVQSTVDARNVLLGQLTSARQAVVASEGSFDRYIDSNIGTIIEQTGSAELARLQTQIANLSTLKQQANDNLTAMQGDLADRDFSSLSDRLADEAIQRLEQERQNIIGQIDDSETTPLQVDLRERLAAIEVQIEAQAQSSISGLQEEITETQNNESRARQALRSTLISSGLSADALTEIYDLQQQSELARQQYDQLLARSQQLQAEATLQLADSRVVSQALRPGAPSWPNTRLLILLASIAGLVLGVVLAFLYERFIGGVTTQEQLASTAKSNLALTVPKTKLQAKSTTVSDTIVTSPLSSYSEAVRRIRANVDRQPIATERGPNGRVVMVTSTAPGEGKTTLSLSLARSYALSGRRTILIDCDLRRPSVHRQLGATPEHGLSEVLTSDDPMASIQGALSTDEKTGMATLLSTRNSSVPTDELIAGRSFARLIDAARKAFDVVILDTPPLGPVVDGLYLAQHADTVLYVVQWAATSQSDVRRALLTLEGSMPATATLLPILNQQDMSTSTYYRRYSGYYSEAAG